MLRKVFMVSLLAAAMLSVSACGNGSEAAGNVSSPAPSSVEGSVEPSSASAEASQEGTSQSAEGGKGNASVEDKPTETEPSVSGSSEAASSQEPEEQADAGNGKEVYEAYGFCFSQFEVKDGILSVTSDTLENMSLICDGAAFSVEENMGFSFSYPVAEDCRWDVVYNNDFDNAEDFGYDMVSHIAARERECLIDLNDTSQPLDVTYYVVTKIRVEVENGTVVAAYVVW